MTLAQRVRDYRYSKGWGPDELAREAAISRTALYQIESGKTELPRAGTLRRIALALDVSMETLLGHAEVSPKPLAQGPGYAPQQPTRPRPMSSEWYPSEGAALTTLGPRPMSKYDPSDVGRFGVEHLPALDHGPIGRERELAGKLHDLLASPFAEPVARILEETHRLLPQARVAGG
jgi:transcriptional regulator with XRE-family HTH domain